MNKYAFNVFLEKQKLDEAPRERMTGASENPQGLTRSRMRRIELAKKQAPEIEAKIKRLKGQAAGDPAKMAALQKKIDVTRKQISNPANLKSPQGELRRQRLAKAEKLKARGGKGSVIDKAMAAISKRVRAVDTPQNRERLKRLGRAGLEYAKTGAFSGQFGREMKARGVGSGVQYKSALGALKGGASTQIIGTGAETGSKTRSSDPLAGLDPVEKRRARMAGAAGPVG